MTVDSYMFNSGYSSPALTSICTIRPAVTSSTHHANIGMPLKNTSVMVVADRSVFTPVLRGAIGELCFGGDQIVSRMRPETCTEAKYPNRLASLLAPGISRLVDSSMMLDSAESIGRVTMADCFPTGLS